MKKIPIKIISTQEPDVLHVRFIPTDICNFNCSYCFPGSGNVNKFRYPKNIDTVIKNFRILFVHSFPTRRSSDRKSVV